MKNKLPVLMIVLGLFIAVISIFADSIGLGGRGGIPALQILGAEAGIAFALAGMGLKIYQQHREPSPMGSARDLVGWVLDQPILTWMLIGFIVAYVICFLAPAIYNPGHKFQYFTNYLYEREKVGFDTRLVLEHIGHWYLRDQTPKYLYPPLTTVLFTPLWLLRFPYNYYVVTVVTLVSYLMLNLLLPLLFNKKENKLLIIFIFAVSIFSYGLQFELETGQFYTLAMLLSMAAIYIFHRHPSYRIFAYILFCISVQFKIFPAIFIFLFVDDWRDWKANLKRFAALGLANFLLLFLLGFSYLQLFIARLFTSRYNLEALYNHSIKVFVINLAASGYGLPEGALLDWIRAHAALIQTSLYAYVLICFLAILIGSCLRNQRGVNFSLLMVCLIMGITLPSISHDYNLPLLAAPFALLMSAQRLRDNRWVKAVSIALIGAASFAYAVTLFPSNARPAFLENSFPALFVLLTAVTLLSFMQKDNSHMQAGINDIQYFTKKYRSGDFSRILAERLKSLLRFRDLLILRNQR